MTDVNTLFNRLHAFFMALQCFNSCAFSRSEGPLKYPQELEQFCSELPFLMAAGRAIRKKVFRLIWEQRATCTSFSQTLARVLTSHEPQTLWNDARTTAST